ncbi:hypothetical protein FRB90_008424 [Tulasnella sp. 427]|nr:hypothetical protein FRB90_008424 [Tulasnella sp. 427]
MAVTRGPNDNPEGLADRTVLFTPGVPSINAFEIKDVLDTVRKVVFFEKYPELLDVSAYYMEPPETSVPYLALVFEESSTAQLLLRQFGRIMQDPQTSILKIYDVNSFLQGWTIQRMQEISPNIRIELLKRIQGKNSDLFRVSFFTSVVFPASDETSRIFGEIETEFGYKPLQEELKSVPRSQYLMAHTVVFSRRSDGVTPNLLQQSIFPFLVPRCINFWMRCYDSVFVVVMFDDPDLATAYVTHYSIAANDREWSARWLAQNNTLFAQEGFAPFNEMWWIHRLFQRRLGFRFTVPDDARAAILYSPEAHQAPATPDSRALLLQSESVRQDISMMMDETKRAKLLEHEEYGRKRTRAKYRLLVMLRNGIQRAREAYGSVDNEGESEISLEGVTDMDIAELIDWSLQRLEEVAQDGEVNEEANAILRQTAEEVNKYIQELIGWDKIGENDDP